MLKILKRVMKQREILLNKATTLKLCIAVVSYKKK